MALVETLSNLAGSRIPGVSGAANWALNRMGVTPSEDPNEVHVVEVGDWGADPGGETQTRTILGQSYFGFYSQIQTVGVGESADLHNLTWNDEYYPPRGTIDLARADAANEVSMHRFDLENRPEQDPVTVVDRSDWYTSMDGSTQVQTEIGRSNDGYHFRNQISGGNWENEPAWSQPYGTMAEAIEAGQEGKDFALGDDGWREWGDERDIPEMTDKEMLAEYHADPLSFETRDEMRERHALEYEEVHGGGRSEEMPSDLNARHAEEWKDMETREASQQWRREVDTVAESTMTGEDKKREMGVLGNQPTVDKGHEVLSSGYRSEGLNRQSELAMEEASPEKGVGFTQDIPEHDRTVEQENELGLEL